MLNQYKQYLWTTSLYIFIQALITLFLLTIKYGLKTALLCFALCFCFSFGLEYIGVSTGFPFGIYSYSSILQPVIFGVPLAIILAWFVLVVNSLLSFRNLAKKKLYIPILLSSIMVLSIDLMLEPFATFVNGFWIWENSIIPFQNFISWFIAAIILTTLVSYLVSNSNDSYNLKPIRISSLIILILNILNFIILNLTHGYYELSILGIVLLISAYTSTLKTNEEYEI